MLYPRRDRASKIVKLVLKSAINRLDELEGRDRKALAGEFKEWMINPSFNDDVWFSTDKSLPN